MAQLDNEKIELDIYGNSDDEAYEALWRSKTKSQPNIHWKGKLQQTDVVRTMQEYDALCLCSTFSEMSPLVIQEAFTAGTPVIASNVYGNAEQIRHGENGLLFQFKDIASLKVQLLRCVDDPFLVQQLKNNVTSARSFQQVGDEYYQIYQTLLS